MSCMKINPEVASVVANFMSRLLNQGFNSFGFEAPQEVFDAFSDCRKVHCGFDSTLIFRSLLELNEKAYCGHYKTEIVDVSDVEDPQVDLWKPPVSKNYSYAVQDWHYQLLKCVQFVQYQLDEDANRGEKKVSALHELYVGLALFIASHEERYMQFKWGSLETENR